MVEVDTMDIDMAAVDAFMDALVRENSQVEWQEEELEKIQRSILDERKLEIKGSELKYHPLSTLPSDIGELIHLEILDLYRTNLTLLPVDIGELTNLHTLNLSSTQLITLPENIGQLIHLERLNLSKTPLTTLSAEIGQVNSLHTLDLSRTRLAALPREIGQLNNLQRLILGRTRLAALPREIGQLISLHTLDIHAIRITTLPREIGQLRNLHFLHLNRTQLTSLPPEIGQLTNLHTLNLSGTHITHLPPEIGQVTTLHTLNLRSTRITTLPSEIGQLKTLHTVILWNTWIITLPHEIGQLVNLHTLDLSSTRLTTLPDEIGQLINLHTLDLSFTWITTLTPKIRQLTNLHILKLSHTKLVSLPRETEQLIHLKELHLYGTYLNLPPEITQNVDNPEAILDYYFQSSQPLNEAKIVLMGEGGVGKTSLVRQLLDQIFQPNHVITEGIHVRDWLFEHEDETYRIHLWDFGGQELMHTTHQFFLTNRTLYLLVVDASHTNEQNRLHYWLHMIQSFGGDSPIIIVRNHADEGIVPCDKRRLLADYSTIQHIYTTSCKTGDGLETLWTDLPQHLLNLPHIHDRMPTTWYQVKERCETTQKDYISYERFIEWCEEAGMEYEYEHKRLLGFLHDLGVVLCFQDNRRLIHTPVLNPSWVADGIYRILHARQWLRNEVLNVSDLPHILEAKRYPSHIHTFLLDLMQKFEVCFPLPTTNEQQYLIPDLLPNEQPTTLAWIDGWDDSLRFLYHYPKALPRSILGRLMVRLHPLLDHDSL